MNDLTQVTAEYQLALDELVERLQSDPTVIAVVLMGSLAHDQVWEKSDIDLVIVRDDRKARKGSAAAALTSRGLNVHAGMFTRAEFRKSLQSAGGGSISHSMMALGRMVFTRDESLREMFEQARHIGEHDRRIAIFDAASWLLMSLDKVEKWLRVKKDAHYATVWLMQALAQLASVQLLREGILPGREA